MTNPIRRLCFAWFGCLVTESDWLFEHLVQARNEVADIEAKIAGYDRRACRKRIFQKV